MQSLFILFFGTIVPRCSLCSIFWSFFLSHFCSFQITGRSVLHPLFSFPLTYFWSSVLFSTPCQINISPSKTSGDKERAKSKMKWQLYTPPLSSLFNSAALVSTALLLSSALLSSALLPIIQSSFIQLGHPASDSQRDHKKRGTVFCNSFVAVVINISAWASAFLCGRERGV